MSDSLNYAESRAGCCQIISQLVYMRTEISRAMDLAKTSNGAEASSQNTKADLAMPPYS